MRHPRKTLLALYLTAAATMMATGCSDDEVTPEPAYGRITVHLMDTPFPFDMVDSTVVDLDSVSVHVSGNPDGLDGFYTIDRTARTIDLLELQNGVTDSLGSALVPVGGVDQIRLYVGNATIYLDDGRNFNLDVPSGSSSGIKVFPEPPILVPKDGEVEFLLDFDVSGSFSAVPNAPQQSSDIDTFHFHPVLRVANLPTDGDVSGTVFFDEGTPGDTSDDSPLEDAAVIAYQSDMAVASTSSDVVGSYLLMGLAPGTYDLVASRAGFEPDSVTVNVVAGIVVTADDLVLSATP